MKISTAKNFAEDELNLNNISESKIIHKNKNKDNYDFFIGFSVDKLNKIDENGEPYIENSKIECTNCTTKYDSIKDYKFNCFKCATLQAIDKKNNKILTGNFYENAGYELDENDLIAKFFFWTDGETNPDILESISQSAKSKFSKKEKKEYKTTKPPRKAYYSDCDSSDFLKLLKSKTINRLEKIKKLTHKNKNIFFKNVDSSDESFNENNYEIVERDNAFVIKFRNSQAPQEHFIKENGTVKQKYNEICCFPKDRINNKLSVKRLFAYNDWLINCPPEQIYNIVEIQLANFPNEQIRVIYKNMRFEMLSTEQFIDTYVKDQNKKKEYLKQLGEIKNSKNSNIIFNTRNNLKTSSQKTKKMH